jgi:biopolymer transport protein ExbD
MPKLEETQQTPGRHARRAIFMVTAPMMQQGFGVQLPQSTRSTAVSAPFTITVPLSFKQDQRVRLDQEFVRIDDLAERVRQVLADRLDRNVLLASDSGVTMGEVTTVFDALNAAGVRQVGIQTQPAVGRR